MQAQSRSRGLRQRGFTLVELMVGVTIGLLSTLVIASVLVYAENNKRSASTGSDAQINGGLAIYAIQRQLKMAGYGLATDGQVSGCVLRAQFGGVDVVGMPPTLAPVLITQGANDAPDTVRVLAAATPGFSLPVALGSPFYNPTGPGDQRTRMVVKSSVGFAAGDLLALVYGRDQPCQVFQASATDTGQITRSDSATWNGNQFPNAASADGAFLINLGTLSDLRFSVTADKKLRQTRFDLPTQADVVQDLQSNIVDLKALYGKDTDGDDVVDTFDAVTPVNNLGWLQVRAVRVAIVARSAQFEKEEVTTALPLWDVGKFASVAGATACGDSKCLTLKIDGTSDWKHYRYKVFDVLVPLRNQVWRGDFTTATPPPAPASGAGS
nr:PilW family protein [uncultured Roseateles sp.]